MAVKSFRLIDWTRIVFSFFHWCRIIPLISITKIGDADADDDDDDNNDDDESDDDDVMRCECREWKGWNWGMEDGGWGMGDEREGVGTTVGRVFYGARLRGATRSFLQSICVAKGASSVSFDRSYRHTYQ